jgi:phospholipid/cholesterol/gamma-HCH transport system ATP-binding protein
LNQSAPIVDIRNLDYAVGGRPIFAGLDIQIPRGKITAVMGPSGTGKTTLLRLITGQVIADGGAIDVAGEDLRSISRTNLYVLRRRMGMLFQNGALLTDLSVFENVAFPLREHTDLTERLIRQLVHETSGSGLTRRGGIDAGRTLRRDEPACGTRARHRHGPGTLDLR